MKRRPQKKKKKPEGGGGETHIRDVMLARAAKSFYCFLLSPLLAREDLIPRQGGVGEREEREKERERRYRRET